MLKLMGRPAGGAASLVCSHINMLNLSLPR